MIIKLDEAYNIDNDTTQYRIVFKLDYSKGLCAILNSEQTPKELADILVELAAELERA